MLATFTRFKNIIILITVIVAAFIGYSLFFAKPVTPVLSQTGGAVQSEVDQELIALLLQLKAITLDNSIFSNIEFQSLKDFSQALVPEPVGRPNPFAPLGK